MGETSFRALTIWSSWSTQAMLTKIPQVRQPINNRISYSSDKQIHKKAHFLFIDDDFFGVSLDGRRDKRTLQALLHGTLILYKVMRLHPHDLISSPRLCLLVHYLEG